MIKFFKSKFFTRRKLKRLKTSLNGKFKIISGENPAIVSSVVNYTTKNISPFGLGLEASTVQIDRLHISHDNSMMAKNKLDIELELPSTNGEEKQFDTVHFLGEVAWYDKQDSFTPNPYQIGVNILEISDEDKSRLEHFVKNC